MNQVAIGMAAGGAISACLLLLTSWARSRRARRPRALDLCEVCGAPSTHELGDATDHGDGTGSGMVACYCRRHKPKGAVRVR